MTAPWAALVIDDDAGVRQSLRLCLEAAGAKVHCVGTGASAREAADRSPFDVVFLDLWLGSESGLELLPQLIAAQPDAGVVVITAFASYANAVEAMKLGAADYLPKPFTPDQVRLAASRVTEGARLRVRLADLERRLDEQGDTLSFGSRNPTMLGFLRLAERAAASEGVVLLRGESGTGKNVLARWIHARSQRATRPYVSVNCPSLTNDLMSSALFGHRRGAFTGAFADAVGKVQEAERGTLFLDEIGDLTADAQARLLRFLNDRSYERVGDPAERRADVRLIAATNRDLEADVANGRFRQDLLYRVAVLSLTIPPLRERSEDVLPLAHGYLRELARRMNRPTLRLTSAAEDAIAGHAWPGNLRELHNAIERAAILTPSSEIGPDELGLASRGSVVAVGADVTLEALEREHLARIVMRSPTMDAAARTLGIDATTLQRKRKRYGLA